MDDELSLSGTVDGKELKFTVTGNSQSVLIVLSSSKTGNFIDEETISPADIFGWLNSRYDW